MNMVNLELFDRTKTYVTPDGRVQTPEAIGMMFAIVNIPDLKLVIQTDITATYLYTAPEPLGTMAQRLGLDYTLYATDEDLLVAMENILNAPQPEPEPTAEERIAASLEYQNLML
jgi:hypothetical protein